MVKWDVTPPRDRAAEAQSLLATAQAITQLTEALKMHGRELDVDAICARFSVPVAGDLNGDGRPDVAPKTVSKTKLRAVPEPDDSDEEDEEEAA